MTIFNNKNGSFVLIYFYLTKISVFPWKCTRYVDVIVKACCSRKKTENRWYTHIIYIQFQHLSQGG